MATYNLCYWILQHRQLIIGIKSSDHILGISPRNILEKQSGNIRALGLWSSIIWYSSLRGRGRQTISGSSNKSPFFTGAFCMSHKCHSALSWTKVARNLTTILGLATRSDTLYGPTSLFASPLGLNMGNVSHSLPGSTLYRFSSYPG